MTATRPETGAADGPAPSAVPGDAVAVPSTAAAMAAMAVANGVRDTAADEPRRKVPAMACRDSERTRKRPRADTTERSPDDVKDKTETPAAAAADSEAPQTYALALEALNASFLASVREQLRADPSSDLTTLTREYEASVRELRVRFAAPDVVANALRVLDEDEAEEDTQEQHLQAASSTVSFVASSDIAETGERELDDDELYFGASLDIDAMTSSSRQMEFVRGESTSGMDFGADDGFLVSERSFDASSSIWNDPQLQRLRVPCEQLQSHSVLSASGYAENWRGACVQGPVVIKRLASAAQTMANAVAFAQHVSTIAPLRHPRIVALVGVAWQKALDIQVASEFLPRGDLRSLLDAPDAPALSWSQFKCQAAIDVVDAIACVHSHTQRAAPCQATSRKVLLDESGSAKLQLLQLSVICGAAESLIPWTAPEVLKAGPCSPQSDIYTVGVLLCELDSTRPPYAEVMNPDGSKMPLQVVAQRVALGQLAPAPTDACPPQIAALTRQCLLVDAAQRPEAARVAYALREILKNDL